MDSIEPLLKRRSVSKKRIFQKLNDGNELANNDEIGIKKVTSKSSEVSQSLSKNHEEDREEASSLRKKSKK
jgi:hypothetical protein